MCGWDAVRTKIQVSTNFGSFKAYTELELKAFLSISGIGDYASWFLGAVIFRDVQTGKKYQFANDRWLAVEYTDGEVR